MVVTVGEMMSLHVKEYTYRITENDVSKITCSYKVFNKRMLMRICTVQVWDHQGTYNNHTRLLIFNRKHR